MVTALERTSPSRISLSNSLGAMAGRGNEQQAARMRVADTVRDLGRGLESAEAERNRLKFGPADEAAVNAARARAGAATTARVLPTLIESKGIPNLREQ